MTTKTINRPGREELNQRMGKNRIVGFSSMGQFSQDEQHAHLDEIERILTGRRMQSQKAGTASASSIEKDSAEAASH